MQIMQQKRSKIPLGLIAAPFVLFAVATGAATLTSAAQRVATSLIPPSAVSVPVTLKTRLGWDHDSLNAPDIARRAEAAGIRMITIHGRTRCQFYKGAADWAGT